MGDNQLSQKKVSIDTVIAIISMLIALSALFVSIKSCNDSVTANDFKYLLNKTDSVIGSNISQANTSDSLLHLSLDAQKATDNANKMRFITALCNLGSIMGDSAYIVWQMQSADGIVMYVREIAPILEGQLNNPFLEKDTVMLKLWNDAYVHIIVADYRDQLLIDSKGQYYVSEDGKSGLSAEHNSTPLDKILKKPINRNFYHAWKCIVGAYDYGATALKKDISRLIKT